MGTVSRARGKFTVPVSILVSSVAVFVVAVALAAVALASWPTADDYCNRVVVAERGIGGAIRWLFFEWSGRLISGAALYLTFALVDLPPLHWVSLMLACLLVLASWQMASLLALRGRVIRGPLSAFILAALVVGLYRLLGQTVFWATGGVVYMIPLVLTLLWLVPLRRLLHGTSPLHGNAYGFALGFAVGNSIELVLPPLAMYVALVVSCRWQSLPVMARRAIGWRVAGVAAGALLLIAAPGNYARATATPDSFRLEPWVLLSQYVRMLHEIAATAWPMVAIIFAVAAASLIASYRARRVEAAGEEPSPLREAGALATGALLSIVPVLAVPAQFAPRNGLYLLVFAFIAALLPLMRHVDQAPPHRVALPAFAGLAMGLALIASPWLATDAQLATAIRDRQVERDHALRQLAQARQVDAVVAPIGLAAPPTLHYIDVSPDSTKSNNVCTAKYYGLHSIALEPTAR